MRFPALLIAGALAAACAADPRVFAGASAGGLPLPSPDIIGTITEVSPQVPQTDIQGTVLVEELPGQQDGGKIRFRVTGNTEMLRRLAGADQRITFGELRVGQSVQVWSTGPIARSYPGQGEARSLLVTGGP